MNNIGLILTDSKIRENSEMKRALKHIEKELKKSQSPESTAWLKEYRIKLLAAIK